eukprot:scaffold430062_cov34-Prasinocladus_malaysianus.AAC.1
MTKGYSALLNIGKSASHHHSLVCAGEVMRALPLPLADGACLIVVIPLSGGASVNTTALHRLSSRAARSTTGTLQIYLRPGLPQPLMSAASSLPEEVVLSEAVTSWAAGRGTY